MHVVTYVKQKYIILYQWCRSCISSYFYPQCIHFRLDSALYSNYTSFLRRLILQKTFITKRSS